GRCPPRRPARRRPRDSTTRRRPRPRRPPRPRRRARHPAHRMARERILVVDDEPGMRRAIDRVLGRHYPVTEAASAEDALAEMARETFDLVLADIRMPGMDGLELLSRIRSTSAADVILMTGSLGEGDERLLRAIQG